jgi:hypothetical protein
MAFMRIPTIATVMTLLLIVGCNRSAKRDDDDLRQPVDPTDRMPLILVGEEYVLTTPGWVDVDSFLRPVQTPDKSEAAVRSSPQAHPRFRDYASAGTRLRVTRVRTERVEFSQMPIVYARLLGHPRDEEVRLMGYSLYGRLNPQTMQRASAAPTPQMPQPSPRMTMPTTRTAPPSTRPLRPFGTTLPSTRPTR